MTENSSGLVVSFTKRMIDQVLQKHTEFYLSENIDQQERSIWKIVVNSKYSLVLNLYVFDGYPFLNISIGLADIPHEQFASVCCKALSANEYLGSSGRYGVDGTILSFSHQLPLSAVTSEYVQFIIEHSNQIATEALKEFKEKFALEPLIPNLKKVLAS